MWARFGADHVQDALRRVTLDLRSGRLSMVFDLIFGCVLIGCSVATSVWLARSLRSRGESSAAAWRFLLRSGMTWFGVLSVAIATNAVVGGIVFAGVFIVFGTRLFASAIRGARGAPSAWRRIGDPEAWRGHGDVR